MVILGKLVHSISINPVLSTIKLLRWFIVCQEVTMTPDIGIANYTIQIAQASEKASNRNYLLNIAQTVQYLARPGWPYKKMIMRLIAILPSLSVVLCGNHIMIRPVHSNFKRRVLVWPSRQFKMRGPQTLTKLWYFSIQNTPEWRFLQMMAHIIIQYLMFRDKINMRLLK